MIPAADVSIDERLVRELLLRQAPQWAGLPLRLAAQGWDNVMVRLGDRLVARLPRRASAAPLLLGEATWAPRLAPHLPLPVPVALFVGAPQGEYPYPWAVTEWFDGAAAAELAPPLRDGYADQLAHALAAFHGLHADTVPGGTGTPPRNPVRGVPVSTRAHVWRDRLADAAPGLAPAMVTALERAITAAEAAPENVGPAVWLHGDPHPLNVLAADTDTADADASGGPTRLTALLDLGDLTTGDPASDLGAAWLHFTAAGLAHFRRAYDALVPSADPGRWVRARGWAANYVMTLREDPGPLGEAARQALAWGFSDPL